MSADAHLVALLGLQELGPFRLRALLDAFGSAEEAWGAVCRGRVGDIPLRSGPDKRLELVERWRTAAVQVDVDAIVATHRAAGIEVVTPDSVHWPTAFVDDPEPPPLVFVRGDPSLLVATSVAIVGTRRCTAAGAATARDLGEGLAAAGVGVVSGLALGIDGAAHRGALRGGGPVVGVVATGLDVVYPRRHRDLWSEVGESGLLVSEAPLGTGAERWRFPARNRLIASLAQLVVVVESGRTGGSMLTVESAMERQVDVGAVPGPVRSPASAGPNQLLADGCCMVRDATDVLVALGTKVHASAVDDRHDETRPHETSPLSNDPVANAVGWTPTSLDDIVATSGISFADVAARLTALELDGTIEHHADGYQWRSR